MAKATELTYTENEMAAIEVLRANRGEHLSAKELIYQKNSQMQKVLLLLTKKTSTMSALHAEQKLATNFTGLTNFQY